ncbi:MAG: DNA-processing protein DprA [Alphaproteobacteria bacterium]
MNKNIVNKLLILRMSGIGPVKYANLVDKFGSVDAVVAAMDIKDDYRDMVLREIDMAESLKIRFVSDDEPEYPQNLKVIKNHPPVICVRGNIDTLKQKNFVAMVGTRHASITGMQFMSNLAENFAENSVVVVSGLAIGTDTAAHLGALHGTGNTQTIAVVAGGVDYIWPLENEKLYWDIVERGAIISEMPVGFVPKTTNFIQRNRWVAGLADYLVLGEADLNSGSMATAKFESEYGRTVWAIPSHPADERSQGPNSLIADGKAKLCRGFTDFFQKVEKNNQKKLKNNELSDLENLIIDALGSVPVSESVLAEVVKKNISEIKGVLVMLELRGIIRRQDGGYVLN